MTLGRKSRCCFFSQYILAQVKFNVSVGAGSVLQYVIAHDGNAEPQLFRAAITNSTFLPSQYQYDDRVPL
ncbi:hypothetical protein B0H11DRAFT_1721920 [Mycena galericulata]|nr:hypothetical protein B0H11DRAFT_1721920 [Mycena galericulata]